MNNTLPDNYIWQEESSSIIVISPGYYHILFCGIPHENHTSMSLSLLVNGQVMQTHHSASSSTVLHLSPNSKVSLVYNSETRLECILQL